jgi:hypothetical protein
MRTLILMAPLCAAGTWACGSSKPAGPVSDAATNDALVMHHTDATAPKESGSHEASASETTGLNDAGDTGARADAGVTGPRFAVALDDMEIVGPFPSWGNAQTGYGAVGDGQTDDTQALQQALSDLGTAGKPTVLYLPAGDYKITSSLTFNGAPPTVNGPNPSVKIIGADPTTTKITWAGPTGDAMLIEYAGYATSFSRLTWDGQNTAGFGIAHWFNTTLTERYDGSTEDEDEVFEDMSIGIMAGRLGSDYGQLNSEGVIRRVTFLRNAYAGFDAGSFNALDWWIYDSQFVDCGRGVTNDFSFSDNTTVTFAASGPAIEGGAGAMYVYRSFFQGSIVADVEIGNTGWFSMHQNVSIGSRRFFESAALGPNAAPTVIEGNRIVNTTDPSSISNGNLGPLLLIDNQIRSLTSSGPVVAVSADWVPGRDVLSVGNTYTVTSPIQTVDAGASIDRHVSIDDTTAATTAIAMTPLTMPPTPAWSNRMVFEVAAGSPGTDIQTAINAAASAAEGGAVNPVVHLPPGTYAIGATLVIPAKSRIQLAGDSLASVLQWQGAANGTILHLTGPSYATVRDLYFLANTPSAIGILADDADQVGGRILLEGSSLGALGASNLTRTALHAQANPYIYTTLRPGLTLDNVQSFVAVSTGPLGPVAVSGDSKVLIADSWYEGVDSDLYRIQSGTFTYLGGELAPATHTPPTMPIVPAISLDGFSGTASFIAANFNTAEVPENGAIPAHVGIYIGAETPQTNALFMGITDYWGATVDASTPTPFYFDRTSSGGDVGLYLSKTVASGAGGGSMNTPNQGDFSDAFIVSMLAQARALTWDTAPYVAPSGATDVRIYRVSSQDSSGFTLSGE